MMIFKRKQKFVFLFTLIGISIMVLLFYSEIKISIFNPKISPLKFNDPNTFISKHILEMSKKSDIVVFLWDPTSVENDWTGILKSRHLVTQEQIDEYLKEKQQQREKEQQQSNSNSQKQQQQIQHNNKYTSKDDELYNDNNKCSVSCRFTNIPEEFVESHLVLFDPTYLDKDNWKRSPLKLPEKHKHQKFALMHYGSSSQYSILDSEAYNKLMDLNISYKDDPLSTLDLDVTLACPPNNSFTIEDTAKLLMKKHTDFNDRINSAVFISSNCYDGLSLSRTNLVAQLSQTIPIYSLGKCLNRDYIDSNSNANNVNTNNNSSKTIKHKEELKNLDSRIQYNIGVYSKYKFTICFENENSTDYITEKVYTALYAGSIPIWMGSKTINKWVPTGSIINANEFNSINELGLHIADLISGTASTARYFEWKEMESLENKVYDKLQRCINSVDSKCKLCETIAKQLTNEQKKYRSDNVMTTLNSYHSHYSSMHLEMKGLGDHIVVDEPSSSSSPGHSMFNLENHFTLMAWVKPNSFSDQRIIDKNLAGTISGYNFDIQKTTDGRGVIRLCAGSDCYESFKSIPNDLWTHIAVVFSCNNLDVQKNRVTFFINGEKNSEYENFNPTRVNNFPLIIGKSSSKIESQSFDGKLDNIMIFNSSLSVDDIKEVIWDKPNLDTYKHKNDLILYYDFDNNPNQIQDSKTSNRYLIRDKSLYKNDGHLQHGKKEDYSEKVISISKEFSFNNKL